MQEYVEEFIKTRLIFYPHLLLIQDSAISTVSLFPFLSVKERDESIICKSLHGSKLITPSFDNSLLIIEKGLWESLIGHLVQNTLYYQGPGQGSCQSLGPELGLKFTKIPGFGHGFLVFENFQDLNDAFKLLRSRQDLQVLTFEEYKKRIQEYILEMKERNQKLSLLKANLYNSKVEREIRTVYRFTGVHSGTNSKILKKLFEIVAPVCFIEYIKGSKTGKVRFKSQNGGKLAKLYFSKEFISQKSWDDLGSFSTDLHKMDRILLEKNDDTEKTVSGSSLKRKLTDSSLSQDSLENKHTRFV